MTHHLLNPQETDGFSYFCFRGKKIRYQVASRINILLIPQLPKRQHREERTWASLSQKQVLLVPVQSCPAFH